MQPLLSGDWVGIILNDLIFLWRIIMFDYLTDSSLKNLTMDEKIALIEKLLHKEYRPFRERIYLYGQIERLKDAKNCS